MAEEDNGTVEDLVQTKLLQVAIAKQANERIYAQILQEVADLLESTPEAVHDALSQACTRNGLRSVEAIDTIYDFLLIFTEKRRKDKQHE